MVARSAVSIRFTAVVLCCVAALRLTGQVTVPEFLVNTYTTGTQRAPSAAAADDGDFVIVWDSTGQDGSSVGVFGQRHDASGARLGSEFRINTYTTGDQRDAAVAGAPAGQFVVVWSSSGQDGADYGVFGQRYDAAGTAAGSEFQVNTYTTNKQWTPVVAMDATGDFVVVWSSYQDGSTWGIFGQRYDASGNRVGSEFQVNTWTNNFQRAPAVGMDDAGNFVVAWNSYAQEGPGSYGVFGQRYNSAGVRVGSEFLVNAYTTGQQYFPSVSTTATGEFVITWFGDQPAEDSSGVTGQRYSATGAPIGSYFRVNTYTTSAQRDQAVAVADDGHFVVSWQSYLQDGSGYGVFGQRFDASGNVFGSEFRINTYTTGQQGFPTVAADGDGNFVVAWHGLAAADADNGVSAALIAGTGTIVLVKQTNPDGSDVTFDFDTSSLGTATTTLSDGQSATFNDVPAGTYRVDEVVPAGWELDAVTCTVDTGANDTGAEDATGVDVVLNAWQTVTCTFTDRQLQAGLSVTKTTDASVVSEGETITWTITVANSGPDGVTDAVVTDDFPSGVSNVTWTCSASGGATCTASGSGDINDTVDLPAESEIVYTATGTVNASARGNLENTATVEAEGFGGASSGEAGASALVSAVDIPLASPRMLLLMALMLAVAGAVIARRS